MTSPNPNPIHNPKPDPNPNLNVVVDLRNKKTLKSFSYAHTIRPFRNLD